VCPRHPKDVRQESLSPHLFKDLSLSISFSVAIWAVLDAHLFALVYLFSFASFSPQKKVVGRFNEWPFSKICVKQVPKL